MSEVTVHFIRHAESDWNLNKEHLVGGRSNETPLTKDGVWQAMRLGRYLGGLRIDRPDLVYASPAVRTLETARISLNAAGIATYINVDDRLQELSQGEAEGKPRTEVYSPSTMRRTEEEGLDFRNPGGQSMREVGHIKLDWLNQEYDNIQNAGYAYVFGHGLAIRCLVGAIEGWDHMQIYQAKTPNASMTTVHGQPGDWRVGSFAFNPINEVTIV